MTGETIAIICFALVGIAIFCLWWFWLRPTASKKKLWHDLDNLGIARTFCEFKYRYTTPNGVRIRSTVEVPSSVFALIEEGISNQITRHNAKFPSWNKFKTLSDYALVFIDPMAVNVITEPGSPALRVLGVQTAGTCIGCSARSRADQPTIVLPHQASTAWRFTDYLMHSAWHESEHIREYVNDYGVFLHYVGAGDVHPHVP